VGIAFQSLKHEDVENIGYVIPTPVIMHFIKDYEKNGAYTGISGCSFTLFNPPSPEKKPKNNIITNKLNTEIFSYCNCKVICILFRHCTSD
jgi:hypothetical protein